MLKIVKSKIPEWAKKNLRIIRNIFVDEFAIKCYSQEGEDMILNRIFEGKTNGFYVDIGAHHPRRFSNTHFFYKRGWSGINVEPNPDIVRAFSMERTRDKNIQCGISIDDGLLNYYHFSDAALNTFDESIVQSRLNETDYKLVKIEKVYVRRLDAVLKEFLPEGQEIDFLSIDVEGLDLSVLTSNDWDIYRPYCVLAEVLNASLEDAINGDIAKFMFDQGYSAFARTYNTIIFCDLNKK